MTKEKRIQRQNKRKDKNKIVYKHIPKQKPKSRSIPLTQLPLYKFFETEPNISYWYDLLPEVINIQGKWIENHLSLVKDFYIPISGFRKNGKIFFLREIAHLPPITVSSNLSI